jgi:hypothetical protein
VAKRGTGRPKGSKSYAPKILVLTSVQSQLQKLLQDLIRRLSTLTVRYVVMDGYFGNYPTAYLVETCGLALIAKIRQNAALYFPYTGPKPQRGKARRYGEPLELRTLPSSALKSTTTADHTQTDPYPLALWHKDFPTQLNGVVLVKTDLTSQRRAF